MKIMLIKITRYALPTIVSLLVTSCVSGYNSHYTPAIGATPEAIENLRASPPPATPIIERSAPTDPGTITSAYFKRGYGVIGFSKFNSGRNESEDAAIRQGQNVGADLVLVFTPQYTGSVTSSMPITTPTTSTSYTSGSATAYGSGGSVTAYGNSTTTSYGTKTNYVPITVHRSNYGAVYFIKTRSSTLGAIYRNLNDAERQDIQSNQGVVITSIRDDSPAFIADLLSGDIIISVDGIKVKNEDVFSQMINERKGQNISLSLVRREQGIEKIVQLNK